MTDDDELRQAIELTWWSAPGPSTDLSTFTERLRGLPPSPSELYDLVQGLVVHESVVRDRGLAVTDGQACSDEGTAADVLRTVLALRDEPVLAPRELSKRAVGSCFHSAVFYCALLRTQSIPARARCGFASYLIPDLRTCHWIVERWDDRWVHDDPDVDRRDLGHDAFRTGVDAWRACRRGDDDPGRYGLPGSTGWPELQGSVVCDLGALAKVERFQYSAWPLADAPATSTSEAAWLDELADAALVPDLPAVRSAAATGFTRRRGIEVATA